MFDRLLIEGALPSVASTPIAHYTKIANLNYLLAKHTSSAGWSSAWATPVQFLNDRKELTLGLDVLRDVAGSMTLDIRTETLLNNLFVTLGDLGSDAFQMSFSAAVDDLGQWRGYASNGMGCALVTDALAIKSRVDVAGWVVYKRADQETVAASVLSSVSSIPRDQDATRLLVATASFMKHEGFASEREYRILVFPQSSAVDFRANGDRLVPYVDYLTGKTPLPVLGIVIGPGWQLSGLSSTELARNHVVQAISRLLDVRGLSSLTIESSSIPYDPR